MFTGFCSETLVKE